MPTVKIGERFLASAKPTEKEVLYFDSELRGFGLRVMPSGARSWIVDYRPGAGGRGVSKRRLRIGNPDRDSAASPRLSPGQARAKAAEVLAQVRLGADPSEDRAKLRADITVAELCDRYLEEGCSLKKASTIATDKGRIERHIKPLLGKLRAREVACVDVDRFLRDVAKGKTALDIKTRKYGRSRVTGGKGTATRTVRLLGGIFTWAISQGLRDDNPTKGVQKFPDKSGERYLTSEEMTRLGEAIREAEAVGIPHKPSMSKHAPKVARTKIDASAAAALRLLIFTGCRVSEILKLRWSEVDLERGLLFLPDSKTGRKTVVLSNAAQSILTTLPRLGVYVIASESAGQPDEKPRSDLKRPWAMIRRHAGLDDVRLHDLRHSFASVGAGSGLGLPIIGKLLGHSQASTTQRYAHLDADPVRAAANAIAGKIEMALKGGKPKSL